jgi:hypothetical protein
MSSPSFMHLSTKTSALSQVYSTWRIWLFLMLGQPRLSYVTSRISCKSMFNPHRIQRTIDLALQYLAWVPLLNVRLPLSSHHLHYYRPLLALPILSAIVRTLPVLQILWTKAVANIQFGECYIWHVCVGVSVLAISPVLATSPVLAAIGICARIDRRRDVNEIISLRSECPIGTSRDTRAKVGPWLDIDSTDRRSTSAYI